MKIISLVLFHFWVDGSWLLRHPESQKIVIHRMFTSLWSNKWWHLITEFLGTFPAVCFHKKKKICLYLILRFVFAKESVSYRIKYKFHEHPGQNDEHNARNLIKNHARIPNWNRKPTSRALNNSEIPIKSIIHRFFKCSSDKIKFLPLERSLLWWLIIS